MTDNNDFNQRSDNAAAALKAKLGLSEKKVQVGPDGKPPAPPPPQGSYAAMAAEQQKIGDQPAQGLPEQAIDGSQAPPPTPSQESQVAQLEASQKAQERFSLLTSQLREKDQMLQQALAAQELTKKEAEDLKGRFAAMEAQHKELLQANLDHLDPETRLRVMQDAQLSEMLDKFEERIEAKFKPTIESLNQHKTQTEMMELGRKYPRFDIQIHGPLIDMFKGKHPGVPLEMCFKAIAEPEELVTREPETLAHVPPVVAPGPSVPKYAAQPSTPDPESEMVADAQQIRKLRESLSPAEQKEGLALADKNLRDRLFPS